VRVFLSDVPLDRRAAGVRDLIAAGEIDPEEREVYFALALDPPPGAAGWVDSNELPPLRAANMTPEQRRERHNYENRAHRIRNGVPR
jgi:hypothetical protein